VGGDNSYAVPHTEKWGGMRPPVPHPSTPVTTSSGEPLYNIF